MSTTKHKAHASGIATNSAAPVITVARIDDVPRVVAYINNRTRTKDKATKEARVYARARSKITLPSSLDAWLKKDVPA